MTTSDLIGTDGTDIARRPGERLDRHPAAMYLASLESQPWGRTMREASVAIGRTLTEGADARTLPWAWGERTPIALTNGVATPVARAEVTSTAVSP